MIHKKGKTQREEGRYRSEKATDIQSHSHTTTQSYNHTVIHSPDALLSKSPDLGVSDRLPLPTANECFPHHPNSDTPVYMDNKNQPNDEHASTITT
jgi:hypothetical protein